MESKLYEDTIAFEIFCPSAKLVSIQLCLKAKKNMKIAIYINININKITTLLYIV